ncbi:TPA: hypothetical protein HA234_05865 [Candidatus Woesearchaeota archaeon]|nr:hypothetical protein [Candidatus Woesearchaeota archaeon]HII88802.1 hypothetical protein [Candidatus Woesearchaeota archaeon]
MKRKNKGPFAFLRVILSFLKEPKIYKIPQTKAPYLTQLITPYRHHETEH